MQQSTLEQIEAWTIEEKIRHRDRASDGTYVTWMIEASSYEIRNVCCRERQMLSRVSLTPRSRDRSYEDNFRKPCSEQGIVKLK